MSDSWKISGIQTLSRMGLFTCAFKGIRSYLTQNHTVTGDMFTANTYKCNFQKFRSYNDHMFVDFI